MATKSTWFDDKCKISSHFYIWDKIKKRDGFLNEFLSFCSKEKGTYISDKRESLSLEHLWNRFLYIHCMYKKCSFHRRATIRNRQMELQVKKWIRDVTIYKHTLGWVRLVMKETYNESASYILDLSPFCAINRRSRTRYIIFLKSKLNNFSI